MPEPPPLRFYVLSGAIVVAPFLGLLVDFDLGLLVMAVALAATLWLVWEARTQAAPAQRARFTVLAAVLGVLALAAAVLLVARRFA